MLFDKKITPSCSYCIHGTELGEGEVACIKLGITSETYSCRRFTYDPLKRVPDFIMPMPKPQFTAEDFQL